MNLFLPALMFTTLVDDISDNNMNTFFEVLLYTTSRWLDSACGDRTYDRDNLRIYHEVEA